MEYPPVGKCPTPNCEGRNDLKFERSYMEGGELPGGGFGAARFEIFKCARCRKDVKPAHNISSILKEYKLCSTPDCKGRCDFWYQKTENNIEFYYCFQCKHIFPTSKVKQENTKTI